MDDLKPQEKERVHKAVAIEWLNDAISNMEMVEDCLKLAGKGALIHMADLKQVVHRLDCLKQLMEMGD